MQEAVDGGEGGHRFANPSPFPKLGRRQGG
jgi:hypothetical protein